MSIKMHTISRQIRKGASRPLQPKFEMSTGKGNTLGRGIGKVIKNGQLKEEIFSFHKTKHAVTSH